MLKMRCGYCLKEVRDKPVLGTLHLCKTPAEIEQIKRGRAMMEAQRMARPVAGTLFVGLERANQAGERA